MAVRIRQSSPGLSAKMCLLRPSLSLALRVLQLDYRQYGRHTRLGWKELFSAPQPRPTPHTPTQTMKASLQKELSGSFHLPTVCHPLSRCHSVAESGFTDKFIRREEKRRHTISSLCFCMRYLTHTDKAPTPYTRNNNNNNNNKNNKQLHLRHHQQGLDIANVQTLSF